MRYGLRDRAGRTPEADSSGHNPAGQKLLRREVNRHCGVRRIAFVVSAGSPYAAIGGFAVLSLWLLDAYYLREERSFRRLYDFIRKEEAAELGNDRYFTMDVSVALAKSENLFEVAKRKSLLLLYIPFLALIVLAGVIACL